MKNSLLWICALLFSISSMAQPSDTGGGGLPFGSKHSAAWNSLSKDAKTEMIEHHKFFEDYFKDLSTKWKECFGDDSRAPNSLIGIYINFTVKRQLKLLQVNESYGNCSTKSEQRKVRRAERKALKTEKREERCIFQDEDYDGMKKFLKGENSILYLQLKNDISKDEAESIHTFFKDLL